MELKEVSWFGLRAARNNASAASKAKRNAVSSMREHQEGTSPRTAIRTDKRKAKRQRSARHLRMSYAEGQETHESGSQFEFFLFLLFHLFHTSHLTGRLRLQGSIPHESPRVVPVLILFAWSILPQGRSFVSPGIGSCPFAPDRSRKSSWHKSA